MLCIYAVLCSKNQPCHAPGNLIFFPLFFAPIFIYPLPRYFYINFILFHKIFFTLPPPHSFLVVFDCGLIAFFTAQFSNPDFSLILTFGCSWLHESKASRSILFSFTDFSFFFGRLFCVY